LLKFIFIGGDIKLALKKGDINKNQTTKSIKKKMERVKESNIDLTVETISDGKVLATITMDTLVEPYVRNRMSGAFKKDEEGKTKMAGGGHLYDPLNTYKKYIQKELKKLLTEKYPEYILCKGEIEFEILLWAKPPQSFTKRQLVWSIIRKILRPLTKPDVDNVAKTAMDFCSKIFWEDDNQVVTLIVRKYYGEQTKTIIKSTMDLEPLKITGRANKEEEEQWKTLSL
jgi:Holliday junction resolvase RusA-like endonuclease